jgi:hypothetical protein
MHTDKHVTLAMHIFQPAVDEIVSGLEIQPGEWFIDPEEVDSSRPRNDFGKDDARFLTITLGKEAIPLVFNLQPGEHLALQCPVFPAWIEAFNNFAWGKVGREIYVIGQIEHGVPGDTPGQRWDQPGQSFHESCLPLTVQPKQQRDFASLKEDLLGHCGNEPILVSDA